MGFRSRAAHNQISAGHDRVEMAPVRAWPGLQKHLLPSRATSPQRAGSHLPFFFVSGSPSDNR
jgi:hypothetical protein